MENMEMKVIIFENNQHGKYVFRAFQILSNSGKNMDFHIIPHLNYDMVQVKLV